MVAEFLGLGFGFAVFKVEVYRLSNFLANPGYSLLYVLRFLSSAPLASLGPVSAGPGFSFLGLS